MRALKFFGLIFGLILAFTLLFVTKETDIHQMRIKYGGSPSQFVQLQNGLTVHLRDEGARDAVPIILLHGSNSDLHTWGEWSRLLENKYRVIRFDQRGHGLTGPAPDADYSLSAFTEDIELVADHLGLKQFVIAGSSMGGSIAVNYALEKPESLLGMVLVNAGGAPIQRDGPLPLGFRILRMPLVKDLAKYFTPRFIFERSLLQSVSKTDFVTDEEIDRYWELARYPGNLSATMKRATYSHEPFSTSRVGNILLPTLVLWGDEDTLIPVAAGDWYTEHLPNSVFIHYKGVGHIPHQEIPYESINDLENWLGLL